MSIRAVSRRVSCVFAAVIAVLLVASCSSANLGSGSDARGKADFGYFFGFVSHSMTSVGTPFPRSFADFMKANGYTDVVLVTDEAAAAGQPAHMFVMWPSPKKTARLIGNLNYLLVVEEIDLGADRATGGGGNHPLPIYVGGSLSFPITIETAIAQPLDVLALYRSLSSSEQEIMQEDMVWWDDSVCERHAAYCNH